MTPTPPHPARHSSVHLQLQVSISSLSGPHVPTYPFALRPSQSESDDRKGLPSHVPILGRLTLAQLPVAGVAILTGTCPLPGSHLGAVGMG